RGGLRPRVEPLDEAGRRPAGGADRPARRRPGRGGPAVVGPRAVRRRPAGPGVGQRRLRPDRQPLVAGRRRPRSAEEDVVLRRPGLRRRRHRLRVVFAGQGLAWDPAGDRWTTVAPGPLADPALEGKASAWTGR